MMAGFFDRPNLGAPALGVVGLFLIALVGVAFWPANNPSSAPAAPARELLHSRGMISLRASTTRPQSKLTSTSTCIPREWVLGTWASGHWVLDYTDQSWGEYLEFLDVPKEKWPDEFNCTDLHQYAFTHTTFIMNHTIPKTGFHIQYESDTSGKWVKNPYPSLTPSTFSNHTAKVNSSQWRNSWDGGYAQGPCDTHLRTEMPLIKNDTQTLKPTEYVVTFWRELTAPSEMKATLVVETVDDPPKKVAGPCYRYFKKKCVPTDVDAKQNFCF